MKPELTSSNQVQLRIPTSLLAIVLTMLSSAARADLQVGVAQVDITPLVGTPMQAPQRPPFEIKLAGPPLDPLHVKAIVMQVDNQTAALVSCDLTSIPTAVAARARQLIQEGAGIPGSHVMISATHTHTAPQIRPRFLGGASDEAKQLAHQYIDRLPERIAQAVIEANSRLEKVAMLSGTGVEESVSFNRRYRMRDGSVQMNPGKNDASQVQMIVSPDGPIDPTVSVVRFDRNDGTSVATMVNFCIHLDTTGGPRPSADFPVHIDRILATVRGQGMLTQFTCGTSGNINHYDLLDPVRIWREKGEHESARIGSILAAEVLKTYRVLEPRSTGKLGIASRAVRLVMPEEKGMQLAKPFGDVDQFFDGEVQVFNVDGRQQFEAEVQVIALGDEVAWVGFPGELFVELGLALKTASPFAHTVIHSLANGTIGYVPDRKAYRSSAYENLSSRCAPGSGEKLVEVASELLIELSVASRK